MDKNNRNRHRQVAEAMHNAVQSLTEPAKPLTSEQRVVVEVCDGWLREAGLPTYTELSASTRGSASVQE